MAIDNLKKMPIWVNWKLEERDGKKTKIPYNPRTGGKAQSNNPHTWTDFHFAQSKSADYNGVGFMFTDGICGIDIDNKSGNPELDRQAQAIIKLMDTVTERSPSGTGYHLIFKCDMSKIPTVNGKLDDKYYFKNPHNDLECYFAGLTNRYFTYTGETINDKNIEDRTEQVLIFLENYMLKDNFKKKKEPEQTQTAHFSQEDIDIIDKIRRSKQGYKFSALFDRGDISAYNNDDSAADSALCYILAWWLQGDFYEIDRYFRQSRLYRDKWERADYRTATINKAVSDQSGNFYKPPGRPKKEKAKKEYSSEELQILDKIINDFGVYSEEKFTMSALAKFLLENDISVKYNEITREIEITGKGIEKWNKEYIAGNLPIILYNDLNLMYKRCTMNAVQDFLKVITMQNTYNPILDMINAGTWDGADRLPELYRIMRIDDSDRLSKMLVYKWLWQNLSMLRNTKDNNFGADGLLVLKGGQGVGKTSFARKMALKDEFFGESLTLDIRNKDTILRAVSCWIGELGEIESTFKSDINALKGFITLSADKERVPYGRTADKLPRRTSFIGTCNSDEYLIDETGNRRYWTVPINGRIDLEALDKFDMLQLYLQINEKAKDDIQGFRLTPDEIAQLAERNSTHEKLLKGEQEVKDILYKAEQDNLVFEEMTVTEFKELYPILRNYSGEQIGKTLKKQGILTERKRKNGKIQRLAELPRPKHSHKRE